MLDIAKKPTASASKKSAQANKLEDFRAFLVSEGHRVTHQRMAIFEACLTQSGHFTAEDLLDKARRIDRSISRATVYRSMPIMIESGFIREVDVGRDFKYYSVHRPKAPFQAQVVCLDCDNIFEVDAPFMEWYGKTVSERLELEVESQRLQVTAHCHVLREKGICTRGGRTVRAKVNLQQQEEALAVGR
jgi:Fur family ferric uptake transcriptional regulator